MVRKTSNTNKLILQKEEQHKKVNTGTKPIFINTDLLDKVRELKVETNIPMKRIIERFIEFAIDNVEIIDPEKGDD